MHSRRSLLKRAMALVALQQLATRSGFAMTTTVEPAARNLDLLILGGTGFLGPHQVEYALARGHRVTIFNRGRSAAGMYGDRVETLLGNRDPKVDAGLTALAGSRRWDAVIDNSGYMPEHVRASAELLRGRVARYVFVSSVAVYEFAGAAVLDEQSPLAKAPDPPHAEFSWAAYGALKAECDRVVRDTLGEAATVVRPGYIVGPGDDTDRFTYWVDRLARGGEVLGPPEPERALQWVDVRDLCPWLVELAGRAHPGIYNAAGPASRTTWREVVSVLGQSASPPPRLRWPTPALLEEMGVELPLTGGAGRPARYFEGAAARAAGLEQRPLEATTAATLAWWRAQTDERRTKVEGWPTPEQERAVLARLGAP